MELASVIAAAVSAGLGCAGGAAFSSVFNKRELAERDERIVRITDEARTAKRRTETTEKERAAMSTLLRRACLIAGTPEALIVGRASARNFEAIASSVRGFAFLDDVVIADRDGLARTRDETARTRTLAAFAPAIASLQEAFANEGVELGSVDMATADAVHITARVLPPWAGGAVLLVSARSRPPNPLAIDAAVARAWLWQQPLPYREPRAKNPLRGVTGTHGGTGSRAQSIGHELSQLQARGGSRATAFAFDGQAIVAVLDDGPSAEHCQAWCARLEQLRKVAKRVAKTKDIVQVAVTTNDGVHISYCPIADQAGCAVFAVGASALDGLDVERFLGRVRRLLPAEAGFEPRRLPASSETA